MSVAPKRLFLILVAALLATAAAPVPAGAVQAPSASEAHLLSLINDARQRAGKVALQWDGRLADIAQYRSDDMARNSYFAHPPMDEMGRLLASKGIAWYRWGETIALNSAATAHASAENTFSQWRNSSAHWNMLMDVDFNYVAFGVARATDGRYYWTGLLLKGPDRTPPQASIVDAKQGSVRDGKRSVTVAWAGREVPLSVLTSGLRDFRVQRKVGTGDWVAVTDWTTATSRSFELAVGKTYRFRVRARDNAGNRSTWSAAITVNP
ncbi:MAG TPA: CAP domain-containing protein [Candidatus Limnocylindrales bacterium]|nr:CAP domain-containing protein [Candidatus Limnocylindrales bacterium]